jgi:hypothetical protein
VRPTVSEDEYAPVQEDLDATIASRDQVIAMIDGAASPKRPQQRRDPVGQAGLVAAHLETE